MPELQKLSASNLLSLFKNSSELMERIINKVLNLERISPEDALYLFEQADINTLGILANYVREYNFGNQTFYNRNIHIEPTNVCIFSCKFCAYSCSYKHRAEGWELSIEDMLQKFSAYDNIPITEVHIVGGVHPKLDLKFFCDLLTQIKRHRPDIHIKAFTAVELDYMIRKAKLSIKEGLQCLKQAGLDSLPGGGAEIFNLEIRKQICADKVSSDGWLEIHKTAHQLGLPSNATILYGHIESYQHRIEHMQILRNLQDETKGFNAFIPLKFRNQNNEMSQFPELTLLEDMRMYAVSRIFMDNIKHIKAYWPMLGRHNAQLALSYGVDDIDGTIDDSTKIYTMAGAEEQNPTMSTDEILQLIHDAGRVAIERDSVYRPVQTR